MTAPNYKVPGGNQLLNSYKILSKIEITEGMKVADLGCGARGPFSLQSAKMVGDKGIVYAVDIMKSALQSLNTMAQMRGINNIKTIWADLDVVGSTKIKKSSIDLVIVVNILFQLKERTAIIKEAYRIIKPGGKMLIIDWKKTNIPFGPSVDLRISPSKIKQAGQQLDLILEQEFDAGPYHFGLLFSQKE